MLTSPLAAARVDASLQDSYNRNTRTVMLGLPIWQGKRCRMNLKATIISTLLLLLSSQTAKAQVPYNPWTPDPETRETAMKIRSAQVIRVVLFGDNFCTRPSVPIIVEDKKVIDALLAGLRAAEISSNPKDVGKIFGGNAAEDGVTFYLDAHKSGVPPTSEDGRKASVTFLFNPTTEARFGRSFKKALELVEELQALQIRKKAKLFLPQTSEISVTFRGGMNFQLTDHSQITKFLEALAAADRRVFACTSVWGVTAIINCRSAKGDMTPLNLIVLTIPPWEKNLSEPEWLIQIRHFVRLDYPQTPASLVSPAPKVDAAGAARL